jgi:hypothetical protein
MTHTLDHTTRSSQRNRLYLRKQNHKISLCSSKVRAELLGKPHGRTAERQSNEEQTCFCRKKKATKSGRKLT